MLDPATAAARIILREELAKTPTEIKPFPRIHRPAAELPESMITNRLCLLCGAYGCVPYLLTPEFDGGLRTGDNLLPLCETHGKNTLLNLYGRYQKVRQWLHEHERVDIVIELERRV